MNSKKPDEDKINIDMEKATAAKMEASLRTWVQPQNFKVITETLTALSQALFAGAAKDQLHAMREAQEGPTAWDGEKNGCNEEGQETRGRKRKDKPGE